MVCLELHGRPLVVDSAKSLFFGATNMCTSQSKDQEKCVAVSFLHACKVQAALAGAPPVYAVIQALPSAHNGERRPSVFFTDRLSGMWLSKH